MRKVALAGIAASIVIAAACSSSDDDVAAPLAERDASTPPADSGTNAPPGDAGIVDAASVDPLSTDRAVFFGDSRCAGLAFCEDFESGTLDPKKWTSTSAVKPTIDGTQHARGTKALHISISGKASSIISTKVPFPAPHNRYWGRAFYRFGKLPTGPAYSHWNVMAASGTGVKGEIRISGQFSNGKNLFGVGTDDRVEEAGTGDWTTSDNDPNKAARPVPTDEWICLEWLHAGDTNETHFYWDGVEHPSMATTAAKHGGNENPFILPQFTSVWVGWAEYSDSTQPFEMWVDEVAFDPERIGCGR